MKTRLLLLVLALSWGGLSGSAQQNADPGAAPGAPPAAAPTSPQPAGPANTAAGTSAQAEEAKEPAAPGASEAEEIVPLISFQEAPLVEVIRILAQQAGLNFQYDPRLAPEGKPGPELADAVVSARFENITARQALDAILDKQNLALNKDPAGGDLLLIAAKSAPPPSPTAAEQVAPVDLGAAGQETNAIEAAFDSTKEVPLLLAIQMLAKLAKVNILIDPKVKTGGTRQVGTNMVEVAPVATNMVALSSFGGVSAQQALDAVLGNFGLNLVPDPKTQFSQVTFKDPAAKDPLITQVVQVKYASLTNMMDFVKALFAEPNRSSAKPDARSSQLVLTCTQKEYDAITNLIAQLDTPTRQVLIEARFLETAQNPKSVKGIDWTDTLAAQRVIAGNGLLSGETTTTFPGRETTVPTPSGRNLTVTEPSTTATRWDTVLGSGGLSLNTARGFFPHTAFLNAKGVEAVLSFLNTDADTKTLATPRAVTLDNQETKLEVTRGVPIFDASESIGQAGTTVATSKPNYTNVGTILIVTPRVTGTNVSLKLKPEISRVEETPSRKVVAGKVNEADIFAKTKIETEVMIPSGSTLVMGGLVSDTSSKSYTKVPILGDIPILGLAFRKESKSRSKANLIIFVTPTIVTEADFQPTVTDFLSTPPPPENLGKEESFWNSGKPLQLKKPRP
ncbi:MAG: hypothetical protein HY674_22815 [Chloroflexi bacterium]|nr:hypothetical protein [Chloroflexota bacterium]